MSAFVLPEVILSCRVTAQKLEAYSFVCWRHCKHQQNKRVGQSALSFKPWQDGSWKRSFECLPLRVLPLHHSSCVSPLSSAYHTLLGPDQLVPAEVESFSLLETFICVVGSSLFDMLLSHVPKLLYIDQWITGYPDAVWSLFLGRFLEGIWATLIMSRKGGHLQDSNLSRLKTPSYTCLGTLIGSPLLCICHTSLPRGWSIIGWWFFSICNWPPDHTLLQLQQTSQ